MMYHVRVFIRINVLVECTTYHLPCDVRMMICKCVHDHECDLSENINVHIVLVRMSLYFSTPPVFSSQKLSCFTGRQPPREAAGGDHSR